MPQTEFFTRLVTSTGCGVLLDLTNVYINSVNHGFDPVAFIRAMPTGSHRADPFGRRLLQRRHDGR
jgi:uncharacterized protein (UPF0276 family)